MVLWPRRVNQWLTDEKMPDYLASAGLPFQKYNWTKTTVDVSFNEFFRR